VEGGVKVNDLPELASVVVNRQIFDEKVRVLMYMHMNLLILVLYYQLQFCRRQKRATSNCCKLHVS
jgi:hypothetical protein